ncbi:MAG: YIP1 family protein [Verrucomicrobia bacterium]|nr:YIP1 family protein [Verrucomicrobiota bacterium]
MNSDSTDVPPLTEPPAPSALPVRLANVYAAPGEVFDALRGQPSSVANWLVPAILAALVGMLGIWMKFSQPALLQQMEDIQTERFEQLVADGKMTQEQADQFQQRFGDLQVTMLRIAGVVASPFIAFIWVFLLALVLFLMLRWVFHTRLPYMKTVEIVGLAGMIGVLGGLVTTLLMVISGNLFANFGPMLMISSFDPGNKAHLLASSVNLFTLWWLGVLALGLARVSRVSFGKLAAVLYGLWAALCLAVVFSGIASGGT